MPILSGDVAFYASAVMTDDEEGGGAPTSTVIVDGTSNSVFGDISEAARAGGKVHARKVFMGVRTPDTDTYTDANVILAEVPEDPNVSVVLFEAEDFFEERADAIKRLESYLSPASVWNGILLENHVVNQRSVQLLQRPGTALPVVGQTLYLVQDEGKATQKAQYIRIKSLSSETKTFSYSANNTWIDYQAVVVTCELTDKLRYAFTGSAANRAFAADSAAARLRSTLVADAVNIYGASATTQAVAIGDTTIRVQDIYARVVPSTQAETPLVDQSLMGSVAPMIAASASSVSRTLTIAAISVGGRYVLPTGCFPGSLSLATASGTVTDTGAGGLLLAGAAAGSINYATGESTFTVAIGAGAVTETYRPAAQVSGQAYTLSREVTAENRAYVWVFSCLPLPGPGVLTLGYMAQGEWYELRDDGLGVLAGTDSAYGAGTLSYVTGSVSVTLGALPDVGSELILSWGTPAELVPLTDAALQLEAPKIEFSLGEAVDAGSLELSWAAGGATVTATDTGTGTLAGAATGRIAYGAGTGWMRTTTLPDPDELLASYDAAASLTHADVVTAGVTIAGSLPGAPLEPGSVSASVLIAQALAEANELGQVAASSSVIPGTVRDDGAGGWSLDGYGALPTSSINYATGAYTLVLNVSAVTPVATYSRRALDGGDSPNGAVKVFNGYSASTVSRKWAAGGISFRYRAADSVTSPASKSAGSIQLVLDLMPYLKGTLQPGALMFRLGGYTYVERAGVLYHSVSAATGAGVAAGTLNYSSGRATITDWPAGAWSFELLAGLVNPGSPGVSAIVGRTASRPLKSQSFTVMATALDGGTITAVADSAGALSAARVTGSINVDTGVYRLLFGQEVGGEWQPALVSPSTARYNAVSYSYLPLDAEQIGMDPVRLPPDGRVPIYREGGYVVLGHTNSRSATVSNGQTINLGRSRLSRVWVKGADGSRISTGYSADLDAGTITFSAVAGYAQPVQIFDRIEDMARLADVQINGLVRVTRPISHVYPAGSMLSSALMFGDVYAHVKNVFDQQSWDKTTWSDIVSGSAAAATYDRTNYPLETSNAGAVTERWAVFFTNTGAFQLYGETLGMIATGNTASDFAPINPASGQPYFTIRAAGWGNAWAPGNVLRFNTIGAIPPFWVARCVQQGAETITDDAMTLEARGDVNAD